MDKREINRVLHIISGLDIGGAEKCLNDVVVNSSNEFLHHSVVSLSGDGFYTEKIRKFGIQVYSLEMIGFLKSVVSLAQLMAILIKIRPHIIHGWMNHGNLFSMLGVFIRSNPKPCIHWNIRQSLDGLNTLKLSTRVIIWLNKFLSRLAKTIIYNSTLAREQHEAFGYSEKSSLVIPNGFDSNLLSPCPVTKKEFRNKHGLMNDQMLVGHIGRYHPMKDHETFIAASVLVLKSFPRTKFILVGKDVSLLLSQSPALLLEEVREQFIILDECNDVASILRALDVFCLSSISESFPNVLGEAMCCGVPCVSTDAGDSADILGDTGLTVPKNNASVMAGELSKILSMSEAERVILGNKARQRILSRYELDMVMLKYRQLYERALGR